MVMISNTTVIARALALIYQSPLVTGILLPLPTNSNVLGGVQTPMQRLSTITIPN
jgi:hypothetical protein